MIVLRKPVRIFDVDLLGVAAMLALVAAAYLVIVLPSHTQAEQRKKLGQQIEEVQHRVRSLEQELHRFNKLAGDLRALVNRRIAQAPSRSEINTILNRIMLEAEQTHLRIDSLEPEPPRRIDDGFVCDVNIAGRGHAPDVIAFLDALAAREPYHAILTLNLDRAAHSGDEACRVSIRVRLHLLPDEIRLAKGTP